MEHAELNVNISRTIAASQEKVYRAWLNPELVAIFMKPAPGVVIADLQMDAASGGRFSFFMEIGETRIPISGEYRRLEEFALLEFTWLSSRTTESSLVTIELAEIAPNQTNLTLTHVGFIDADSRDDHEHGWGLILTKLLEVTTSK